MLSSIPTKGMHIQMGSSWPNDSFIMNSPTFEYLFKYADAFYYAPDGIILMLSAIRLNYNIRFFIVHGQNGEEFSKSVS